MKQVRSRVGGGIEINPFVNIKYQSTDTIKYHSKLE
jgi:hypothetical protein